MCWFSIFQSPLLAISLISPLPTPAASALKVQLQCQSSGAPARPLLLLDPADPAVIPRALSAPGVFQLEDSSPRADNPSVFPISLQAMGMKDPVESA